MSPAPDVHEAVRQASTRYYRLVLLVGASGTGKTALLLRMASETGHEYFNLNLKLSHRLLDVTRAQRTLKTQQVLTELIRSVESDVLLLDNLELLFDTGLRLDPLRLLQALGRIKTIVAAWNGVLQGGELAYAVPDHPEYRLYRQVDAIILHPDQGMPNRT